MCTGSVHVSTVHKAFGLSSVVNHQHPTARPSAMSSRSDSAYAHSVVLISAVLFGVTSLWRLRQIAQERERKAKSGQANPLTIGFVREGKVSRRCMRALSPSTPYLVSFLRSLEYACDPTARPDGYIAFCMAENKLTMDVLSDRLQQSSTTQAAISDPAVYCYNSFWGLPMARQAAAYFLAKRFLLTEQQHAVTLEQALQRIRPAHIGIGAGAVALLNAHFYLLGDDGDTCLLVQYRRRIMPLLKVTCRWYQALSHLRYTWPIRRKDPPQVNWISRTWKRSRCVSWK